MTAWSAPEGFSADRTPMIGAAPGINGLWLAVGGSGTGFKIAPAVGVGIAELVTLGACRSVDLLPFQPSRFEEGASLRSPTDYHRPLWREEPLRDDPS
jgi:sarcosine oxidase subunit beta